MTVERCKEEVDAREFEGWKSFFYFGKNGPRTPDNEMDDLHAARALSVAINATGPKWPAKVDELLVFRQEVPIGDRVAAAKATMRMAMAVARGNAGRKKHA